MLHVILLILKILGIILLSILVLLLLIVCAVLFVPVTYRVRAKKKETFQVSAVGGWFFRALSVHYMLDGANDWKQDLRVRAFGITILDLFGEKKPKKKNTRKRASKEKRAQPADGSTERPEEQPSRTEPADGSAERPEERPSRTEPSEESAALPSVVDAPEEQQRERGIRQKNSPSLAERIRLFFSRLLYAIRNICDKIKKTGKGIRRAAGDLRGRIRHLWKRKNDFLEFWNLEEHKRARSAVYKELRYLWKKSRPRRIEGQVRFGFEDPSFTGMCMGALSILYAWYPKKLQLLPDFDREILEGEILIKGRIRLYVAALILWRVWFNKDIRHMYEHWQEL